MDGRRRGGRRAESSFTGPNGLLAETSSGEVIPLVLFTSYKMIPRGFFSSVSPLKLALFFFSFFFNDGSFSGDIPAPGGTRRAGSCVFNSSRRHGRTGQNPPRVRLRPFPDTEVREGNSVKWRLKPKSARLFAHVNIGPISCVEAFEL